MKVFKKIVIGLFVLVTCSTILSTAGCRSLRPAQERIVNDSTSTTTTTKERDTTFKTPSSRATLTVEVKVPCPDQEPVMVIERKVQKKQGNAILNLAVKGTSVTADCFCDTLAIKAKIRDTYQKSSHVKRETNTRTVEVKYVPGWVNFLAWSGGLFWPLFLLGVYIKHFKQKS